jgi:flagellar biosynthesis chaperone FliJ
VGDREELLALRRLAELEAKASGKPAAPVNLKIGVEGMGDAMKSVMKEAGPAASRLAAFGSFPRQMYEGTKQILGMGDEANVRGLRTIEEEHPVSAVAGGVATMVPLSMIPGVNAVAGQAALGGAVGASMPTIGDESRLMNAGVGAATGGAAAAVLKGIAHGTGKLLQKATQKTTSQAASQSVRDATIREAQKAGYVIPPTATGGGKMAVALESLGGKAAVSQTASIRNQQVTNALARKAAGLAPDQEITEATLEAARKTLAQPYREVAQVSQRAAQALEKLEDARLDVKDLWKQYAAGGGPVARKAAIQAEQKVSVLEKLIEKEASQVGKSGLAQRVREARVALAKNHDVENALNLGDGNVDAKVIGKMLQKRGVKGVTGELQTVGKFANAFGSFARHAPVTQSAPGVSALTPHVAAALGLGGFAATQSSGMGPWGMAAAGVPLLRGSARTAALSKMMQGVPSYAPSATLRLADLTARSALPTATAVPTAITLQQIANQ